MCDLNLWLYVSITHSHIIPITLRWNDCWKNLDRIRMQLENANLNLNIFEKNNRRWIYADGDVCYRKVLDLFGVFKLSFGADSSAGYQSKGHVVIQDDKQKVENLCLSSTDTKFLFSQEMMLSASCTNKGPSDYTSQMSSRPCIQYFVICPGQRRYSTRHARSAWLGQRQLWTL